MAPKQQFWIQLAEKGLCYMQLKKIIANTKIKSVKANIYGCDRDDSYYKISKSKDFKV